MKTYLFICILLLNISTKQLRIIEYQLIGLKIKRKTKIDVKEYHKYLKIFE